ncbi:MAG: 3-hydroxyacyl-CoA dehydrogenase NAD-binding domain-containing protein [Planctomycetota bacterium]
MPDAQSVLAVAVFGLGTMGHGIVQTFARAGCRVRGYDADRRAGDTLGERIEANLNQMAEAGLGEHAAIPAVLERITVCQTQSEAARGAQFVVEAVREDLTEKQALFGRLESTVEADAILASNTSSYRVTDIAANLRRPDRVVATHWFNPPHIVPVVEVVPGEKTSAETVQTTYDLLARVGKMPVRVNQEIPGFLVNRVQVAMFREILDLLDRGIASAEDIDRAVRGSIGLRLAAMGPLAIIDFAGWDVTGKVYQNLIPDLRRDTDLPQTARQLLESGRLGVKTGHGIYDYPADSAQRRQQDRDRAYLALAKLLE